MILCIEAIKDLFGCSRFARFRISHHIGPSACPAFLVANFILWTIASQKGRLEAPVFPGLIAVRSTKTLFVPSASGLDDLADEMRLDRLSPRLRGSHRRAPFESH